MIILKTPRQYAEFVSWNIFPYINLLKKSYITNVANYSKVSEEFLNVKLVDSLLSDIELILKKKIINTTAKIVTLKFSEAEAITLYRIFLNLPVPKDDYYFGLVRNNWIEILDQQIFK